MMDSHGPKRIAMRAQLALNGPFQEWSKARDLYVNGRLKEPSSTDPESLDSRVYPTLDSIAEQLGISISTLTKRSMREAWSALRKEAVDARTNILADERRLRDEQARAVRLERDQKLLDDMKDTEVKFRTNAYAIGALVMTQVNRKMQPGLDPSPGAMKALAETALIGTKLAEVGLSGFDGGSSNPGVMVAQGITLTQGLPGGAPASMSMWAFMRDAQGQAAMIPDSGSPLPERP